MSWQILPLLIFGSGCLNLSLPQPPGPPQPGSISGRVVIAQPGRPTTTPLAGAQVEILGSGLVTTSDSGGYFSIDGLSSPVGQILFRADINGDGRPDRQKLLSLEALKAGPNKQVALGDVLLAENAAVRGKILLGDVGSPGGHSGTSVFVPVGPYTTSTADDGSFTLSELPEGTLSIAFFRAGYAPRSFDSITLSSGQELVLRTVSLEIETSMPMPVTLNGRVRLTDGKPASGATIQLEGTGPSREETADSDGRFTFSEVEVGVYSLTASRLGSSNARLLNVLLTGGVTTLPDIVLGPGFSVEDAGTGGGFGGTGGGTGDNTGGGSDGLGGGNDNTGGGTAATGGGTGGGTGNSGGGAGTVGGGSGGGNMGGGSGTAPAAPQALSISPGNGFVTLAWNASVGATSYRLYFSTDLTVSKATGTALPNVASPFVHQGLTNGTRYVYVVTASNANGESADSMMVSAIPQASSSTSAPELLVVRPGNETTSVLPTRPVTLRLNHDLNGATATSSNIVLTSDAGVVATSVTAVGRGVTVTPSAPLAYERRYDVSISTGVLDSGGRSLAAPFSWWFTTSSPPPQNLRSVLGNGAVTLLWDAVPGATYYSVSRAPSSSGTPNWNRITTGPSCPDTSPGNGTSYYYTVRAVTSFGLTGPSNEHVVVPSPALLFPPSGVRAIPAKTTALLSWNPATSATGYRVLRASQPGGPYTQIVAAHPVPFFLDTGLSPDTFVYYVVQSETLTTQSAYSDEFGGKLDSTLASAPANFTATPGTFWARLGWTAVPAATGYVVYDSTFPNTLPALAGFVTQGTSLDIRSLSNGSTYRYFVAATLGDRPGDFAQVDVTPGPLLVPRPVVLNRPTAQFGRILMNTVSSSQGESEVVYLRSTSPGGPYTSIGTSTNDSTVMPGITYYYVARADKAPVQGLLSNEVSATALLATAPDVPANLAAEAGNNVVQLSWSPVANVYAYEIGSSSSSAGPFSVIATTREPFETRVYVSATNGTATWYAVHATNATTASAWSTAVVATAVGVGANAGLPNPNITLTGGNGAVTASWPAVVGASAYRLFRRTQTEDWTSLAASLTTTAYTDTTVVNGTTYRYAVQAMNPAGPNISRWDTSVEVTPSVNRPVRPNNFTVTPVNGGFVVRWTAIAGATNYTVSAGLYPGSSVSGLSTLCSTYQPFDTMCFISNASNGTTYYVSMKATTPDGVSAHTDEVTVLPNAVGPNTASLDLTTGNGNVWLSTTAVTGATGYRFFKKLRDADWVSLGEFTQSTLANETSSSVPVQYAVQAITAQGVGTLSTTSLQAPSYAKPLAPTDVTATAANAAIEISWKPVLGIASYLIYSAPSPNGPFSYRGQTANAFDTRFTLTVANNTPTWVYVVTYVDSISSAPSELVTATASASIIEKSTSFQATAGNQAIDLSWTEVPQATSYRVYRRLEGQLWRQLVAVTVPQWRDTAVENGEVIAYAMQAVGASSVSAWSNELSRTVDGASPTIPENVVVLPGNGAVQVSWDAVPGASGYIVSTSATATGSFGTACQTVSGFDTQCRASATNGMVRWVQVATRVTNAVSLPSVEQPQTPSPTFPSHPSSLTLTSPAAGAARVTWAALTGATGYRIYRRLGNSTFVKVGEVVSPPFDDTGLTAAEYFYTVEAVNAAGPGAWSNDYSIIVP